MSKLDAVVAKMKVTVIEQFPGGHCKVKGVAVYGTAGENKDFADATPSGEFWMNISPGRPAGEFFEPGDELYVTFTKAPKTEVK